MPYKFDPERLAYWYFRLNGFLTIENFILHDEEGGAQRTDLDLVGIRFPHRCETLRPYSGTGEGEKWMEDDERFTGKAKPFLAFVEITTGRCKINGPWTDPEKGNLPRALRAIGVIPRSEVCTAAARLQDVGTYQSDTFEIGIVAMGKTLDPELERKMPEVVQLTWEHAKSFVYERFSKYKNIKREHPQWDLDGHLLWKMFDESNGREQFLKAFNFIPVLKDRGAIQKYTQGRKC